MAECCERKTNDERHRHHGAWMRRRCRRWTASGTGDYLDEWLAYARAEVDATYNPPDERRAWAELVKELEAML